MSKKDLGDFNEDGKVDNSDLTNILDNWNPNNNWGLTQLQLVLDNWMAITEGAAGGGGGGGGATPDDDITCGSGTILKDSVCVVADATAPTLEEVTAVSTPTNDTTPSYTFSSNEAGTISYGGSCGSDDYLSANITNNTITFNALAEGGTYSNCTITVTDAAGNVSNTLNVTPFTVVEPEQMGGSIQGVQLNLSTVVTTLAGTGSSGSTNATGTSARFDRPRGITTDGTNLYVGDTNNHLIRKIE